MLRANLRNQLLIKKTVEARSKYNGQRNIYVSLVKKAKQRYYKDLDLKDINGNKKFWGMIKSPFSNKLKSSENIL